MLLGPVASDEGPSVIEQERPVEPAEHNDLMLRTVVRDPGIGARRRRNGEIRCDVRPVPVAEDPSVPECGARMAPEQAAPGGATAKEERVPIGRVIHQGGSGPRGRGRSSRHLGPSPGSRRAGAVRGWQASGIRTTGGRQAGQTGQRTCMGAASDGLDPGNHPRSGRRGDQDGNDSCEQSYVGETGDPEGSRHAGLKGGLSDIPCTGRETSSPKRFGSAPRGVRTSKEGMISPAHLDGPDE